MYPQNRTPYTHATGRDEKRGSRTSRAFRPEDVPYILEGLEAMVGARGDGDATTHESRISSIEAAIAAGTITSGGGSLTGWTQGDMLYADGSGTMVALAAAAAGNVLRSGTAPSWGKVQLSGGTVDVTGTLGPALGGTGTSTVFTSGSVIYAGASGVYQQDNANFFWDAVNKRLGIGTTSPQRGIHVDAASAAAGIQIKSTGGSGKAYGLVSDTSGHFNIQDDADSDPLIRLSGTDASVQVSATGGYRVSTYARIGSTSAPNNVAAGDLTLGGKLIFGNPAVNANVSVLDSSKTVTDIATTTVAFNFGTTNDATSNNTQSFRNFQVRLLPSGSFDLGELASFWVENRLRNSGGITSGLYGAYIYGALVDGSSVNFTTIANSIGINVIGAARTAGSNTGTITNTYGIRIANSNPSNLTLTSVAGMAIADQTGSSSTNLSNLVVGQLTIPSGKYNIYGAQTMTDETTGGKATYSLNSTFNPAGAANANNVGINLNMSQTLNGTNSYASVRGINLSIGLGSSFNTSVTTIEGLRFSALVSSQSTNFGTIGTVYAIYALPVYMTGSQTGTISTAFGHYIANSANGSTTITTLIGFGMAVQTVGTNNTNLLIGNSATGNWSIYNNSSYNNYLGTGNWLLGTTTNPTSLAKGIYWASGTAPSGGYAADAISLWVADRNATAGKAGLHVRTEDGTSHVLADRVGFGTLVPAEAVEVASGNFLISAGYIVDDDVVRPFITVGGSDTARTFTVNIRKFDQASSSNTRFYLHWWTSTSSFGTSSMKPNNSASVTTGTNEDAVSNSTSNFGWTDSSGNFVVTVSNAQTGSPETIYFHVEVQGIIYQASGSVFTGVS